MHDTPELRCRIATKMLAVLALAHCASAFAPIFSPLQALQNLRRSVDRPSRKRGSPVCSSRLNNLATASGGRRAARFSVGMTESSDSYETELCKAAETFINEENGFYSPCIPDRLAEDFIFRGPVVGPLSKADYISVLKTFQIYKAFPDIKSNAFGFTIDPLDRRRVWFFVRNTGTNTGPFGLSFGIQAPPSGKTVVGPPEAFSVTFDDNQRVKMYTIGYVVDRFQGNTGGLGAVYGLFHAMGYRLPDANNPISRAGIAIFNRLPNQTVLGYSAVEDVPEWWRRISSARGPESSE